VPGIAAHGADRAGDAVENAVEDVGERDVGVAVAGVHIFERLDVDDLVAHEVLEQCAVAADRARHHGQDRRE
jgi:hypothetical protein